MIKKGFSILFLLAFVLQVLYLPTLVFYLEYNQERIAEDFCVNKLEPELMCSGRCYISTVTAEALGDEGDHATVPTNEENIPTSIIFTSIQPLNIALEGYSESKANLVYSHLYFFQPTSDIFHPPRG